MVAAGLSVLISLNIKIFRSDVGGYEYVQYDNGSPSNFMRLR